MRRSCKTSRIGSWQKAGCDPLRRRHAEPQHLEHDQRPLSPPVRLIVDASRFIAVATRPQPRRSAGRVCRDDNQPLCFHRPEHSKRLVPDIAGATVDSLQDGLHRQALRRASQHLNHLVGEDWVTAMACLPPLIGGGVSGKLNIV